MYNILYIDYFRESGKQSDSLIATYYMLQYSGRYITAREEEKEYDTIRCQEEQLISKIAELINSVYLDLDTLLILTSQNDLGDMLNKVNERLYIPADLNWVRIQDYLGYPNYSLFDLYTHYFSVNETHTRLELIDMLLTGVVRYKHGASKDDISGFLIIHPLVRGNCAIMTFAWIKLSVDGTSEILGSEQCILPNADDNYCRLGCFFKQLETSITMSGITFGSLLPTFYSEQYYCTYRNIILNMDVPEFTSHSYLQDLLLSCLPRYMRQCVHNSFAKLIRVFSNKISDEHQFSAMRLCNIMQSDIGLAIKDGALVTQKQFYKDFSSDVIATDYNLPFKYGVILDCEGTSTGGCSEVGGIIYGYNKSKGMLLKIETFYFKQYDFLEGMQSLIERFGIVSGRHFGNIPVLTYGKTDEIMLQNELHESTSRSLRKKIQKSFIFLDAQDIIGEYLDSIDTSDLGNRKLSTVAKFVGVRVATPKHNALSDAKTLFNILAYLCFIEREMKL